MKELGQVDRFKVFHKGFAKLILLCREQGLECSRECVVPLLTRDHLLRQVALLKNAIVADHDRHNSDISHFVKVQVNV